MKEFLRAWAAVLSLWLFVSCEVGFPLTRAAAESYRFDRLSEDCGVELVHNRRLHGMLSDEDTHGGFLGDGERLSRYRYDRFRYGEGDGGVLADALPSASRWKPLPFGRELSEWLGDSGGLELLPDEWPAEGYYCFYDRQAESWDPEGETRAFSRVSLNFTLFVYDLETDILTIYELDT